MTDGIYQVPGIPTVWVVEGGVRYGVPHPDEMARLGSDAWARIQEATAAQIAALPERPWSDYGAPAPPAGGGGSAAPGTATLPPWAPLAGAALVGWALWRRR